MSRKKKVFCIGFHRSGTTTLHTALEELGYNVIGMREEEWLMYADDEKTKLLSTVRIYDAFRDMPWPLLYRFFYETVPNACFILSYRDPEKWVQSCAGNYKTRKYDMFSTIYGFDSFSGNEDRALKVYNQHIMEVREFFADKQDIFLEHDFTKNPSWTPLCEFLQEPIPARRFPHANRRPKRFIEKVGHRLHRVISPKTYRTRVRDK